MNDLIHTEIEPESSEALIEIHTGNLLEAPAEALVNAVNCVGVMGKGIALDFEERFSWNSRIYKEHCKAGEMRPGRVLIVESPNFTDTPSDDKTHEPHYVINFPTKDDWRAPSQLEWISSGLEHLVSEVRARGIASIAIPALGCGNGRLKWDKVRPLIENAFAEVPDVRVLLFPPKGAAFHERTKTFASPPIMSISNALYVRLLANYSTFEWSFTELELQKLGYFLQVAKQDLRLRFSKGRYGPYAHNLRYVLNRWEGHWINGYGDGVGGARRAVTLKSEVVAQADEVLSKEATIQSKQRLERVAQLTEGFESAFGVELLATVHWVATQEGAETPTETIQRVHAWNDYKASTFTRRAIEIAWSRLYELDWIQGEQD